MFMSYMDSYYDEEDPDYDPEDSDVPPDLDYDDPATLTEED